jgi:hypothetical protein
VFGTRLRKRVREAAHVPLSDLWPNITIARSFSQTFSHQCKQRDQLDDLKPSSWSRGQFDSWLSAASAEAISSEFAAAFFRADRREKNNGEENKTFH